MRSTRMGILYRHSVNKWLNIMYFQVKKLFFDYHVVL